MLCLVSALGFALMTLVTAAANLGAQARHCNGSVIFPTWCAADVEKSIERAAAGKASV
jgi:hypothetical protein